MSNMKRYRRDLHQIPEICFKEYKTSKYLKEKLESFGFKPFSLLETDVLVYIDQGYPETIAFRADIDALNVTEENDIDFKSKHEGYMHACGHDGHMAMLLGFAEFLSENLDKLKINILLIFQPAEESIGGAKLLVEKGVLKNHFVKAIFGIHLYPELPEGTLGTRPGEFMAMVSEVDIEVIGKSAHGAMPQNGVDSNLILSKLLIDFQSIQTRTLSPLDYSIITFGTIKGGNVRNVISDYASMGGTIRAFSDSAMKTIKESIKRTCESYEKAYDCKINFKSTRGYDAVINSEKLFEVFRIANKDIPKIIFDKPLMIAEDFSFYQNEVPGLFYYVGTYNEELGYTQSLHNSKFNFDEKALETGLQSYINILTALNKLD